MAGSNDARVRKGIPRRSHNRTRPGAHDKYAIYRAFVGKPNGPGVPGNKAGKNKS